VLNFNIGNRRKRKCSDLPASMGANPAMQGWRQSRYGSAVECLLCYGARFIAGTFS
jgi:hypothetical protein